MTNSSLKGVNKDGNNKITVVQTEKPPYKREIFESIPYNSRLASYSIIILLQGLTMLRWISIYELVR